MPVSADRPAARSARALCLTLSAPLLLLAAEAPAQEEEEAIEEIIATGTRIARDPNLGAPVAIQSVSGENIRLSGRVDVAEVVRQIPALITSETGAGSAGPATSAFDTDTSSVFSAAGESVLQLRGMGTERTLVLVDGRRHVAGSPGTQAVDINTIPTALIERVEVLTGGASAIYGADAVTGVVNFIMKDDFEGFEVDVQGGVSGEGDGEDYRIAGTWGRNFANDRANFTISVDYRRREHILQADRDWSANNAIASDDNNPALRFQQGDIGANTPNFQQFYDTSLGNFPFGQRIPLTADDFIESYFDEFGANPSLTADELALIERAATSPTRLVDRFRTFSISSEHGVIVPGDFSFSGLDLDGNGNEDCFDSFLGWNSLLEGNAFGETGGCWNNVGGTPRIYQDGRVAGNFNQFGGEGIHAIGFSEDWLTPDDDRVVVNLSGRYDLTPSVTFFAEAKYVDQSTDIFSIGTGFYDLLSIAPDNPFIPAELAPIADRGFFVTRDPIDLGGSLDTVEREVSRFVVGLEGEFENGWGYEFSLNRGQTNLTNIDRGATIMDRMFAAIDVTTDGSGNPVCRSDLDPTTVSPTTIFDLPLFDFGYFTFNPGQGNCVPYNVLGGAQAATQENIDWMMTTQVHEFKLEQTVFQGVLNGDLPFGLDAGNLRFAAGAEFRTERSTTRWDALTRGECPIDTPDCAAGELVFEAPGDFRQTSLVFDPEFFVTNSQGDYSVWEVFGEVEIPLLAGQTLAEELTLNLAGRFSQYTNVGDTFTWQTNLVYAPVEGLRLRGSVSQAVRAPNIAELFDPEQASTFRPVDPCEQAEIDTLIANGDPRGAIRAQNCQADGIPAGFADPLSARFSGVTSGNPDLKEEEADTLTVGFVFEPEFLEGLSVSVDYWDIEIEDAIDFVDDQDIVDNCYDSATFPNQFCDQFERERDPTSAQFLGLSFLRQTRLNFGKIESSGVDFSVQYAFELGANGIDVAAAGTRVNELDFFFDPADPTAVDPELGELRRPELAYTLQLGWTLGPFMARWQSNYQDAQALQDVEVETADFTYGPAGFSDDFWSHDLTANWVFADGLQVYGGVTNVTDEEPFLTESAWPVSPRGRSFFVGVNWSMQ